MAFTSNIEATNVGGSDQTSITWQYGSAPGLDPFGHVATWMSRTETLMRSMLASYPTGSPSGHQRDYDVTYCSYDFANHIESTDAQLAEDLRNHTKLTIDNVAATYPRLDDGPTTRPSLWNGYQAYNGGFRALVADPWFPAIDFDQYQQRTVNVSRGCGYSNNYWDVNYSIVYGNGAFPNDPSHATWASALAPPALCREFALAVINHIYSDDWFDVCEDMNPYGLSAYDPGHVQYVYRLVEDWFLYPGGAFDQWNSIDEEMRSVGGDWSLVPRAWRNGVDGSGNSIGSNYDYCPFMRAHSMRALITHYYDDRMGTKDVKPRIIQEARNTCDNWLEFWMQRTYASPDRFCPVYQVPGPGTSFPTYGDPDLANFLMPVAAFAWLHTGDDKYYELAKTLTEAANADGFWVTGKQGNQLTMWTWMGYQWLGWVADPFTVWWRDNP